jgi:hypothetical protein
VKRRLKRKRQRKITIILFCSYRPDYRRRQRFKQIIAMFTPIALMQATDPLDFHIHLDLYDGMYANGKHVFGNLRRHTQRFYYLTGEACNRSTRVNSGNCQDDYGISSLCQYPLWLEMETLYQMIMQKQRHSIICLYNVLH